VAEYVIRSLLLQCSEQCSRHTPTRSYCNFNVNFNTLSKYNSLVHQLVIKNFDKRRILFTRIGYLLHQQDTCYIDRTLGTLTGHFVTLIGNVCYVDRTFLTSTGILIHWYDTYHINRIPVTMTGHSLHSQASCYIWRTLLIPIGHLLYQQNTCYIDRKLANIDRTLVTLAEHLHPRTSVSKSGLYSWVDSPPAIMYEMNVIKTTLNDCTDKCKKHN